MLLLLTTGLILSWSPAAFNANGQTVKGKDALEGMKKLAGNWKADIGEGQIIDVEYKVTSAGTAVMETLFAGAAHEMVTMYYLENDRLVLVHYCSMGNQPKMELKEGSTTTDLRFECVGGDNVKPESTHMHYARIKIVDDATLEAEWGVFKNGKDGGAKKFSMKRAKG